MKEGGFYSNTVSERSKSPNGDTPNTRQNGFYSNTVSERSKSPIGDAPNTRQNARALYKDKIPEFNGNKE